MNSCTSLSLLYSSFDICISYDQRRAQIFGRYCAHSGCLKHIESTEIALTDNSLLISTNQQGPDIDM